MKSFSALRFVIYDLPSILPATSDRRSHQARPLLTIGFDGQSRGVSGVPLDDVGIVPLELVCDVYIGRPSPVFPQYFPAVCRRKSFLSGDIAEESALVFENFAKFPCSLKHDVSVRTPLEEPCWEPLPLLLPRQRDLENGKLRNGSPSMCFKFCVRHVPWKHPRTELR